MSKRYAVQTPRDDQSLFTYTAGRVHALNVNPRPMRGGIRL